MIKIVKLTASVFGIFCAGIYFALIVEYGIDFTLGAGIILGVILAICAGIGVYEDIKNETYESEGI